MPRAAWLIALLAAMLLAGACAFDWSRVQDQADGGDGATDTLRADSGGAGDGIDVTSDGASVDFDSATSPDWSKGNALSSFDLLDVWGDGKGGAVIVGKSGTIFLWTPTGWSDAHFRSENYTAVWSGLGTTYIAGHNYNYSNAIILRGTDGFWTMHTPYPSCCYFNDITGVGSSEFIVVGFEQTSYSAIYLRGGSAPEAAKKEYISDKLGYIFKEVPYGVWAGPQGEVIAVCSGGVALHANLNDTPLTWTKKKVPNVFANLKGVWGSGPTDVYAVGDKGTILHYDGTEWSKLLSGMWTITTNLRAVWGSGPQAIYIVGDKGTVLRYDGKMITQVAQNLTTENLYGVGGNGPDDVFVVGANGTVLRFKSP